MNRKNFIRLLILLALIFLVAWWGSFWTFKGVQTWYANIPKPFWTPPRYVFGPVWTLLYAMMTISAYLVAKKTTLASKAMVFYYLQLFFNALWSTFFFGFQLPSLAFVDIAFLIFCILGCMYSFFPHSKIATYLLIPYLIWVIYASTINFAVMINMG